MQMLWSKGVKYRNGAILLSKCLLLSLYICSQIYSLQISKKKKKKNHSSLTQDLLEFSTVGKTLNKYCKLDIRFLQLDTQKRRIPKFGLNYLSQHHEGARVDPLHSEAQSLSQLSCPKRPFPFCNSLPTAENIFQILQEPRQQRLR